MALLLVTFNLKAYTDGEQLFLLSIMADGQTDVE